MLELFETKHRSEMQMMLTEERIREVKRQRILQQATNNAGVIEQLTRQFEQERIRAKERLDKKMKDYDDFLERHASNAASVSVGEETKSQKNPAHGRFQSIRNDGNKQMSYVALATPKNYSKLRSSVHEVMKPANQSLVAASPYSISVTKSQNLKPGSFRNGRILYDTSLNNDGNSLSSQGYLVEASR